MIREVCDDGSVSEDDLRHIRFGDDVPVTGAKDFFDRCGQAVGLMFRQGAQVLILRTSPINKIAAIKALRSLSDMGLKEAKDYVESPLGTPILLIENSEYVRTVLDVMKNDGGADVAVRTAMLNEGNVHRFVRRQL